MPMFQLVPHPQFTPTACVTCGSNRDPDGFIDLLVDTATMGFDERDGAPIHDPAGVKPTIGHLYLCCTCLFQAANAGGCLTPQKRVEAQEAIATADATIARLQAELEVERSNKVVNLDQLSELIGKQVAAKPVKPKAAA